VVTAGRWGTGTESSAAAPAAVVGAPRPHRRGQDAFALRLRSGQASRQEAGATKNKLARPERFELEPICGRERSGSPQAKSRAERGISSRGMLQKGKLARPERFELPTYSSGV
jgi:hypothetical protein